MSEELSLVTELAIILVAAGVVTIVSKALKQPLILGYILAGFLVGPHLGIFPQFSPESVDQWSEIGIIFLLFSLGLEFSFKKLLKVGSSAFIMALCIFAGMFVVGLILGRALDWSMMESIFLGGMLSMSSTAIIIKTYDDLGLKQKPYAGFVFGTLVIEDLLAVLLMVLLSTMAVSNQFAGGEMVMGIAKLVFFLILWFLVGIYVIPTLLKKAHKYLNDEILLIVSIGLCFLMVVLANLAGFSSALGAFVMGSILSETIEGERIGDITLHIKELFGAIFFISVGMMVDPAVIGQRWGTILIVTIVAMVGISFFAISGSLLAGKGLDNAVHAGFSMAQLGEFAFIIAGVGCSLGVLRDFIYPVIIAVSVITAFATPYVIKLADPASAWLYKHLPERFLAKIEPSPNAATEVTRAEKSEWKHLMKSYLLRVGLYGVLLVAIILGSNMYLDKLVVRIFPDWSEGLRKAVELATTLAVMMPFLYGMAVTRGGISAPASKLMKEKSSNKWPILFLILLRILIAVWMIAVVILRYYNPQGWTMLLVLVAAFLFFFVSRKSVHKFTRLEEQFMANYNEKEQLQKRETPVASSLKDKMSLYDVQIEKVTVSPDFVYAGKKLREMPFRHVSGVNIVKIRRGTKNILIPSGDEVVYPGDELIGVGTASQVASFKALMLENSIPPENKDKDEEFVVDVITLLPDSYLTGKVLRDTDMRASGCMVVSINRDGDIITNPKPDTVFAEGDKVWLAGIKSSVEWYK